MDISGNECDHEIVVDYIDIDPDRSQQIIYCEKCYKTMSDWASVRQPNRRSGLKHQTHSSHE